MNKLLPKVKDAMMYCKSKMSSGGATTNTRKIYKSGGSTKS